MLVVLITGYDLLSPILLSFLLIILITLAVNPVVIRLRNWIGSRRVVAILLTLVFVAAVGLALWAFSVPIRNSTTQLARSLPQYWERLQRPLMRLEKQAAASEARLEEEVATEVAKQANARGETRAAEKAMEQAGQEKSGSPASVRSWLASAFQGAAGGLKSLAYSTTEGLVVVATVFFGVIFTLMNPRPIVGAVFALVPSRHHPQALRIATRIAGFVPNWALATLLGMLVIGFLVFLFMWPIFGFTDALVLGLIAGSLEAVPYLGPTLSALPALLLSLGKGGLTPLWVLLAYIAVQALENNVVLPLIMARGMKLHPVAVIFSMLLCVAAFGVLGVLIAAPMAAIVAILHDELYRKRYLPGVSNQDLDQLAREAMGEEPRRG